METLALLVGIGLILLGTLLLIAAIVRALGHSWGFGLYELWLLPAAGAACVLAGRWLIP